MRNHRLNYAVVGIFVIAMLSAAVVASVVLAGRSGARDSYHVVFDNVADIKFGTQVRFEGYALGQIEDIRPLREAEITRFQLEISVEEGFRIPEDSLARIGASTLLGAKTVDIQRGASAVALDPGATITAAPPADMFAAIANVAGDIGEISERDLRPFMKRMTSLVETADRLIEQDLAALLTSVNTLALALEKDVPGITGDIRTFAGNLNATLGSVDQVLSRDNIEGVQEILANLEEVSRQFVEISINLQGTLGQVDQLSGQLNTLIARNGEKVDGVMEDARYSLGAIAGNIDALNHNFSGAARNMNEFTRMIRQNPGLLLGGGEREEGPSEAAEPQSTSPQTTNPQISKGDS